MNTKLSLKSLFESNQEKLAEKLAHFVLPKDAAKIQNTVKDYLNELFDSNGDFRQNLTQSEDYILEAAMSLLNAQQAMVTELSSTKFSNNIKTDDSQIKHEESPKSSPGLGKELFPHTIGATAIGGAVGGLVLGTWGAFFGSVAGTALILYYSTTQQKQKGNSPVTTTAKPSEPLVQKLDTVKFINIISKICESVDTLIDTFRAQINKVVDKYESQEKPVLEKEYGVLLDSIQSILGAGFQPADEKRQKRIDSRIEQLAESLENYDLEVVKYDENSKNYFDITSTDKAEEPIMVLPAIVKHGIVIRKGKVMVKD